MSEAAAVSKGYKQTEVGVIPEDWGVVDFIFFGQVIDGDRGLHYPGITDLRENEHCLFLNAGNVTKGGFRFTECEFISSEKDSHRRVVHFNVTAHPTANWTAQQIVEAYPWDTAPRYLLRNRDSIYGSYFRYRLKNMGINEIMTVPRSPWQNPFVERLIRSIRNDCLDHLIVPNTSHLKRILSSYFTYYHNDRTHYRLEKDTPSGRSVQPKPAESSPITEMLRVGGLHHRYEWKQAA